MSMLEYIQLLVTQKGSDLYVIAGMPPTLRIDGQIQPIQGAVALTPEQTKALVDEILTPELKERLAQEKEIDFGYEVAQGQGRLRVNIYHQQNRVSAVLRLIPQTVKTIDELQLPPLLHQFTQFQQGLVLVTGPTGEGKSTTLAAMIEEINSTRAEHILTIEDPIEFVYTPKQSLISQRELHQDTKDWKVALKSALREAPDVVLVGEMRDYETIAAAITVAETGHLVFATLHTNSAAQTIDRVIDVFPEFQQAQVRQQLAASLQAVVSQRLVPAVQGGRAAAMEILIATPAIRNLIREGKTYQIDNIMQTSAESGMQLFETHLWQLVQQGRLTMEIAQQYSLRPAEFQRLATGRAPAAPPQT
jgi:twitching motility protein PilT